MRGFMLNFGPQIIWALVIVELVLMVVSYRCEKAQASKLCAAVCLGLAVDAVIQGIGNLLGEGMLLKGLSQIRFILHGLLVPLLIPIAFMIFGIKNKIINKVIWVLTLVVIAAGIIMGFVIKTEPVVAANVLRYAQSEASPAFAKTINTLLSFGGVIPLLLVGVLHIFKNKSAWLFLAGFSMFAFAALAPATHNMDLNFLTTMIGEALMVLFFYLDLRREWKCREP